jgi:hypothetical protein
MLAVLFYLANVRAVRLGQSEVSKIHSVRSAEMVPNDGRKMLGWR